MDAYRKLLAIAVSLFGAVMLLVLAAAVLVVLGPLLGVPLLLVLFLFYGWLASAYVHYRVGRQDELRQLLATAAQSQAPLAPALRAYLRDRPHGALREFWVAVLLFFVWPGYYWFWHQRHNYDQKVARVARRLEQGYPLADALRSEPGVASRETLLAVRFGEATGRLYLCLRELAPGRLTTVWLELLPRAVYPVFLLLCVTAVTGFWDVFLLPKMEKIFDEMHQELPEVTVQLGRLGSRLALLQFTVGAVVLVGLGVALLLLVSSTARWYFPGLGLIYRRLAQARVLQALAVWLDTGRPLPEGLDTLAGSGSFPPVVGRRLAAARARIERGEPLAASLRAVGLLPRALAPLVEASQRVGNLRWALAELGDNLAERTVRLVRRLSLVGFAAAVFAAGLLVGYVALAMFLPLVELITRLAV